MKNQTELRHLRIYMGSLDENLTEAQKKESLVDLLSAFAGSQVSIKARCPYFRNLNLFLQMN